MHMKQIIPLLTALLLPLSAQEENTKEAIIESLMQADNVAQLNSAIAAAKKANLPQQMIVEARFMYHINQDDLTSLAALSPALAKELPTYSPDNTLIFGTKEDYESVVYYTKALGALEKKDIPLFKKHITEATPPTSDGKNHSRSHPRTHGPKKSHDQNNPRETHRRFSSDPPPLLEPLGWWLHVLHTWVC